MTHTNLPKWALPTLYEYDLGMSTGCNFCGEHLNERTVVIEDAEDLGTFYCSSECAIKADEPPLSSTKEI